MTTRFFRSLALGFGAIFCASDLGSSLLASDLFVSPTGNNLADGSSATPFKTIQRAVTQAVAGDTVWVRGGVYPERVSMAGKVGTADRPITIRSARGESAVIDHRSIAVPGGTNALIKLQNCSFVVIQDLELCNFKTSGSPTPIGILISGGGQGIRLVGNKIHGIWNSDPTLYNWDANAHGILVAGNAPTPITDLVIEGNELYDLRLGASEAMVLNGNVDGFIVRNNIIHDANNIGIDFIGYERTNSDPALDVARNGICTQNTVYNIDSRYNPAYGGSFAGGNNDTRGAVGIYADGAFNIVIDRNHVWNCNIGIEIASEHGGRSATGIKVRNNLIRRNHVGGIFIGGYAPNVGGAKSCSVTHNTIYQNDVVGYGGGQIALQHHISDTKIQHNIIVASPGTRQLIQLPNGTGSYAANSIDWNLYSGVTTASAIFMWRGREIGGLGGWKAISGQDSNSFVAANPGFTDAAALDFTLTATAAALNQSDPSFFYDVGEADFYGRVRIHEGRADLGMAEHGAVKAQGPSVETAEAADITYRSAIVSGTIVPGPTGTTVWFEYGLNAMYGKKTAVQVLPAGDQPVTVTSLIEGLTHKKTYHFRIAGNNSTGSNGGYDKRLVTPPMPVPVVADAPMHQLAAVGESASFSCTATGGLPMTVRWMRNRKAIAGAAATGATYVIPKLKIAHSGPYTAAIRNDSATTITPVAVLAVVDPVNNKTLVNEAATLTLAARYSAPAKSVTLQWFHNGIAMVDDLRVKGSQGTKLVVRSATASDAGDYYCQITLGGLQRNTGTTSVAYRPRPVMNPYVGETKMMVGCVGIGQVSATNELIRFTASGLPSGLAINARTGAITGWPNRGGIFRTTFVAHNLAGPSLPLVVIYDIAPLPLGVAGNFLGLIDRSVQMKQTELGGLLRFTVSAAGMVSGGLTFGASTYSFAKRLDVELGKPPVLVFPIKRAGATPSLLLSVTFDSLVGDLPGSITTPTDPQAGIVPFRVVWQGPATRNITSTGITGRYTSLLEPKGISPSDLSFPQGTGYLSFTLAKNGGIAVVGRLTDGSVVSGSSFLGMTEVWPLFQLTHKGLGSFSGWSRIDPFTREVSGDSSWLRHAPARLSGNNYPAGFPQHTLGMVGSHWGAHPRGSGLLGLPVTPGELDVSFRVLGAAGDMEYSQRVGVNVKFGIEIPRDPLLNPNEVKLGLNMSTGLFSGSFVVTNDTLRRKAVFQGAIIATQARAAGYFSMPDLPIPAKAPLLSCPVTLKAAAY